MSSSMPKRGVGRLARRLLLDGVDDLVDAGHVLVRDKGREVIDSPRLLGVGLGAPLVVVVLGHVEEPERDDLVLVADVARVVGALEAGRHGLAGFPGTAELLPRARLETAGRKHDDHVNTSTGPGFVLLRGNGAGRAAMLRQLTAEAYA